MDQLAMTKKLSFQKMKSKKIRKKEKLERCRLNTCKNSMVIKLKEQTARATSKGKSFHVLTMHNYYPKCVS